MTRTTRTTTSGPSSASPVAAWLDRRRFHRAGSGRCGRGGVDDRKWYHGGTTLPEGDGVIDKRPCICHAYFAADVGPDCEDCAAAKAINATHTLVRRPVADPETPPCCHTPQLCGGPHEDCYDAARAEVVTDAFADDNPVAYAKLDPDACSACYNALGVITRHNDADRGRGVLCDHLLPLYECGSCGTADGSDWGGW